MPDLWRKVVRKGVSFGQEDDTDVSTKESEKEDNLIPTSDAEKIDLSAYLVQFQMMNNGDLNKTVDRWLSKVDTDKATFNKMLDALLTNKFIKRDAGPYLDTLRDVGNEWFDNNKQLRSTQPSTSVKAKSLGSIKLNIIEDWVQSGQATTTVRNSSYHNSFYKGDGIYTTDKGNLVNITYKGLVKLQGNKVVGNNISYTKDEFAKAEGFGTWANFQKNAKYAGKTLMDGGSVHLYNITTTQPFTISSEELGLNTNLSQEDAKCNS
jgi:hypothetical protein